MTDERYLYNKDLREKKDVSRNARHKRTHTGRGGRVRLPSDNLTKKELQAMNGEIRSYRLNEPMKWNDFIAMPDDIKVSYIKALQAKFDVTATALAQMFGVNRITVGKMLNDLKIEHRTRGNHKWDKEAFLQWIGVEQQTSEEPACEEIKEEQAVCCHTEKAVPCGGFLTFDGDVDNALRTVASVLGGTNAHITITWELRDNG